MHQSERQILQHDTVVAPSSPLLVVGVDVAVLTLVVLLLAITLPSDTHLVEPSWIVASGLASTEVTIRLKGIRGRGRSASTDVLLRIWLFAAAVLYSPWAGAVLAVILSSYTWLRLQQHTDTPVLGWLHFTATATAVTVVSSFCYHSTGGSWGSGSPDLPAVVIAAAGAITTAVVMGVAGFGSLLSHIPSGGSAVLRANAELACCCLAGLVAGAYQVDATLVVLALPVAVAAQHTLTLLGEAREEAETDPKTGLYQLNRWRQLTQRELARSARTGDPLAVLIVDLDRFKAVNDTHGHLVGDTVLGQTAYVLESQTRTIDISGRFGGEEFVITLPATDLPAALTAAERVRAGIAALVPPSTPARVTASIGVAAYPRDGNRVDDLLHAADTALYRAKTAGRNQIRTADGAATRLAPAD